MSAMTNAKLYRPIVATCMLLGIGHSITAQERTDTIIKGQTIEIIQSYKPEIARAEKPELSPTLPRIDTSRPAFTYEIPQQTLSYTYNSVPIRPLALGRQTYVSPFANYIKAGLGNRSTVYLDAGIGSLKTETYQTTFHLRHLSQKGPVANQYSAQTSLDAAGTYFTDGHALGAEVQLFRNGYSFYGYDHDLFEYSKESLRQTFVGAHVGVHLANIEQNRYRINYRPELTFGMYSDRFSAREKSFGIDLPVSMALDSVITVHAGLSGNRTQLVNDSLNTGNGYFQVRGGVDLHLGRTDVRLQVAPTWGKGNKFYLMPEFKVRSLVLDGNLALIAGWRAELIQNTYEQLSTKNPFVNNLYPVRQTKSDQVYAGLETHVGQHFSFGGTLSWRQWNDMALFVNDYNTSTDGKQFSVVYDEQVQALGLDAFARYQVGDIFGLHAHGVWNNFIRKTTFDQVWHEPMVRLNLGLNTQPLKGLDLSVEADIMDGMYALTADGSAEKIPTIFDMSAQAAYQIHSRFSVFTQLNNLFSQQYQRWYQYPVYGFNIIGGIRFKF